MLLTLLEVYGTPDIHVCTPKESTDPPNIGHNYYLSDIYILHLYFLFSNI